MEIRCAVCQHVVTLPPADPSAAATHRLCPHCQATLVILRQGPAPRAVPASGVRGRRPHWLAVGSVLVLMVLAYAVFGGGILGVLAGLKGSEPYQLAEAFIRHNDELKARVGEDLQLGLLPAGRIRTTGDRGEANLTLTVHGSRGEARVHVALRRHDAVWRIVNVHYLDPSGALRPLAVDQTPSGQTPQGTVEPGLIR
ncbi:MAG: cytochrome c oxidase assembly factor Coa1 family protein [Nitrospirales bacterium]